MIGTPLPDGRTLTDADIQALKDALVTPVADAIRAQMVKEFQLDVGKAVIIWAKRAIIGLLILIAIWSTTHFSDYIPQPLPHQKP